MADVRRQGKLNLKFNAITFLTDGTVLSNHVADDSAFDITARDKLSDLVTLDCKMRQSTFESAIGKLRFDWIGSDQLGFAGASWYLKDTLVNAGVYLLGFGEQEHAMLHQYVESWRNNPITKQLRPDGTAFAECFDIADRPLMVSLNTGALRPDAYAPISMYDQYLGSLYFAGVADTAARSTETQPKRPVTRLKRKQSPWWKFWA